jgi:hypothetical protein
MFASVERDRSTGSPGLGERELTRARAVANGVHVGRRPKLTPHQKREAIKRRDVDDETLRSMGRSYNVSAATISRLVNHELRTAARLWRASRKG